MSGRVAALPDLDVATYRRDPLHSEESIWVEKNCYIDLFIEMVHALGLEARAMLAFTVAVDFEHDQWTFFKPQHKELYELYSVDVQELSVWRSLLDEALAHVGPHTMVATEADAYWLPDTAGTDYRNQHTKTTIAIQSIDVEKKRLGYFHNASYYALEGEDFDKLFRIGVAPDPTHMPFFAERIRFDRKVRLPDEELKSRSRRHLREHFARIPANNPVERFGARFPEDLAWVQREGLPFYHAWAFVNLRQLGAAFELAAHHLRWLEPTQFSVAAESFMSLSSQAKALILKVARAVNGKKTLDLTSTFDEMASAYQRGMDVLVRELGSS